MPLRYSSQQLVEAALAEITTLSVEQLQALMSHNRVQVVDVRDRRELEREGHIAGAFHAPRGMLEFWVDPESPYYREALSADKHLVLYCKSGWRSALAAQALQHMGHPEVSHLGGGFEAWLKAGGAVESL